MKRRFLYFRTGVIICSLIIATTIASLSSAEPDAGAKTESTANDKSVKAETGPSFAIHVKGLACPFCVYGLEKKLKKVVGVQGVEVDLKSGTALVTYRKDFAPDLARLRKAVKKAGFTPGKINPYSKQTSGTKESES